MNADSYFSIGKGHRICQDYAMHGNTDKGSYVIVSDGCSSSPFTDLGARLLAHNSAWVVKGINNPSYSHLIENIDKTVIQNSYEQAKLLNLPIECLDATLLLAWMQNEVCHIRMYGDGFLIRTRKDGVIILLQVEFTSGAPFYLSYFLDPKRKDLFGESYGWSFIVKEWEIKPTGEITQISENTYSANSSNNLTLELDLPISDYQSICLVTDGLAAFTEKQSSETNKSEVLLPPAKVAKEFLNFKGYSGDFVERRFRRFQKDCAKWQWSHHDDLSVAAISFE